MKKNNYAPQPVDTSDVELSAELLALIERIAENVHDVWAVARIADGWTYGAVRDDARKQHPCLVSYKELSENEKEYDRNTAMETLKLMSKLGFEIKNKGGKL